MSLFDTIRYPLGTIPTVEELDNLPIPIYELLVDSMLDAFHLIHRNNEITVKQYWSPDKLAQWIKSGVLRKDIETIERILHTARKAISELP